MCTLCEIFIHVLYQLVILWTLHVDAHILLTVLKMFRVYNFFVILFHMNESNA